MTESDEQSAIDFEVRKFNNRLRKLNMNHKFIQVTGVKLQINHPSVVQSYPWWMFWKR